MKKGPQFTHFGSIPFIRPQYRHQLRQLQNDITQIFQEAELGQALKPNNPNLFHLTLMMLTMPHLSTRNKMAKLMQQSSLVFQETMRGARLTTSRIGYFTYPSRNYRDKQAKNVSVIYLDIERDEHYLKLVKLTDALIRTLLKEEIITPAELKDMHIEYSHNENLFKNRGPHVTLFRCENLPEDQHFKQAFLLVETLFAGRSLCCDHLDISTRFQFDGSNFYQPLYRVELHDDETHSKGSKGELQPSNQQQKTQQDACTENSQLPLDSA